MVHFPSLLPQGDGDFELYDLYICFYREGILFTYSPVQLADDFLLDFLSKRNHVINELLRKRKPYLTNVAVMVADQLLYLLYLLRYNLLLSKYM